MPVQIVWGEDAYEIGTLLEVLDTPQLISIALITLFHRHALAFGPDALLIAIRDNHGVLVHEKTSSNLMWSRREQ